MGLFIKKKTLKKAISIVTMFTTVVWLSGVSMLAVPMAQAAVIDGNLIKSNATNSDGTPTLGSLDVYIVKLVGTKKLKRLILNPTVFTSYGHLNWGNIQTVSQAVMDEYTTSALVRVDTDPAEKVYAMAPDGDIGSKSWVNLTSTEFLGVTGSDADAIYTINSVDGGNYTAVSDVTTTAQLTTFYTSGTLPSTTPVSSGALAVALSANTPATSTVPLTAPSIEMLKFNLTAPSDGAIIVSTLVLDKTGLGASAGVSNVYLYEGDNRLTNAKSVNSTYKTVTFNNLDYTVPAGTTKTLTVKATLITTAGVQHGFSITSASSITIASGTVSGSFPVSGNIMSTVSVTDLGTVTVARSGASAFITKIGSTNVDIGKFSLATGNENSSFRGITIYSSGNDIINNLKIYRGSKLLGTAVENGKYHVVTFTEADLITKGDTVIYTMKGDVASDNTNNTTTLAMRYDTDINITGDVYGYRMAVTNTFDTDVHTITLEAGAVTIAFNGPVTSNVSVNTSNVTLFNFSIFAQSATKIERDEFILTLANADGDTAVTLANTIEDLELICGGLVIADYTVGATPSNTDQWEINAGETKSCIFRGDIKSTADAGDTLKVSLTTPGTAAAWTIKDIGTDTAVSSVVPSATITGNTLTLTAASLAVTNNANAAPIATWVKGATAKTAAFNFAAGDAADITVTDIVISAGLDDDSSGGGAFSFIQTSNVEDVIDSISLWDGIIQVGTTKGLTVGTADVTTTFSGLSWVVLKGTTKTLVAKVAISTNAPYGGTNDYIALKIVAGNVTSQYGTGTALTSVPSGNVNATPTTYQTISGYGTLAVDIPTNTPATTIAVASQTAVPFSKLKFTAANEDMKISKLALKDASSGYDDNISKVWVTYPTNGAGTTTETKECTLASAIATCIGLNIFVPNPDTVGYNNYAIVDVKADMQTITGGADAADAPAFTLSLAGDFEAIGVASNYTVTEQTLTVTDVTGTPVTTGVLINNAGTAYDATTTALIVDTVDATTVIAVGDFLSLETPAEIMYVSAVTDATHITVVRGVNGSTAVVGTVANNAVLYVYGTANTVADLLTVNAMNVQGTKLTLTASTPAHGGQSPSEEVMKFTVATDIAGDAQIRQGSAVAMDSTTETEVGTTGSFAETDDTSVFMEGTASELLTFSGDITAASGVMIAKSGISGYTRVNFWIRSNIDTPIDPTDIFFATGTTAAFDNTRDFSTSTIDYTDDVWYNVDMALPASTDSGDLYWGIGLDAAVTTANADVLYIDNVVFYNEKINVDMTLNADVTTNDAKLSYLKQGATIIATGYADWTDAGSTATGYITFIPVGTYPTIELSGTDTFTVETDTNVFADVGTATENLTLTIDLGNSSIAGDVYWYDVEGSDNVTYAGVNATDKIATTNKY